MYIILFIIVPKLAWGNAGLHYIKFSNVLIYKRRLCRKCTRTLTFKIFFFGGFDQVPCVSPASSCRISICNHWISRACRSRVVPSPVLVSWGRNSAVCLYRMCSLVSIPLFMVAQLRGVCTRGVCVFMHTRCVCVHAHIVCVYRDMYIDTCTYSAVCVCSCVCSCVCMSC